MYGSNTAGGNPPACAHIVVNTSITQLGQLVLINATKSSTTSVVVKAPGTFTISQSGGNFQDAWFSVHDGEYLPNHSAVPFSYTTTWKAHCLAGCPPNSEITLTVGLLYLILSTRVAFDLAGSVGGNLTYDRFWKQDPFIGTAPL
jgi:hypothetical protein